MLFDDKSKGIAQAYLGMLEAKEKKKMDPVGREDGDIDNDGDKDSSDEFLKKRREAISKSVKEAAVDEASSCGMKSKKEALEITPASKSDVSKKGMKDKEGGDEEEDEKEDEGGSGDDEIEITIKKKEDGKDKKKDGMKEAVKSPYAVGMASAMKSTGDEPPLEKSTITKAHKIAKSIMKKESTVWNWDEILEASDEEIDALIEELNDEDLETFVSEFNDISEAYQKAPPNEVAVRANKDELRPKAAAEKSFIDMHTQVVKDHPFDKDQHDQGVDKQSPARPGDNRKSEPMKSLKDIRK